MARYNDPESLRAATGYDGYVKGEVYVHLSDIIDNDLEGFLDLISEALVGSTLLMDVNYNVVRVAEDGKLVLEVTGDPSMVYEED